MFETAWDAGLDDDQLAAASHGDGPLVIMAGAGTGKTRTLTARVAALVDRGVAPERILLLTFTRRAADEMLTRAAQLCTRHDAARRLEGGTFHAVAYRLVAAHAPSLGLADEPSVLDQGDARDLMDLLRTEHELAHTEVRVPKAETLLDIYSRAVNTNVPARQVVTEQFPWCEPHVEECLALFRNYVTRKRDRSLVDFDDLLLLMRQLLADEVLGEAIRRCYDHVLVDKYQDVNAIQVDIVHQLRPGGRGLTVVGDDAQAIYGFRGADSGHLLRLADDLPDATTIRLAKNFRSRQPLLDLANAIRPGDDLRLHSDRLGGARARLVRCHDAAAEARAVVDAILAAAELGRPLREQAVLMRAGHHSDLLEVELTARRVPFVKYGGLKFLEAAHVKDFVAGVRLLENRTDELAWFRLLRLHEGVGPARARALLGALDPGSPDPETRYADCVALAPSAARTTLAATLDGLAAARSGQTPADRAAGVLSLLKPLVAARHSDHAARIGDLERLVAAASQAPSLAEYVAALTLDPPASTGDFAGPPLLDEDYVILSTVHSAKGLEWESVHVIGAVDGRFPSDMALLTSEGLEEERRLFYVASTRARDDLAVYAPLRMHHHRKARDDKHSFAPQSRFLDAHALQVMEVVEERKPERVRASVPAVRVAAPDLDALWS